jgi:hypothetical protein
MMDRIERSSDPRIHDPYTYVLIYSTCNECIQNGGQMEEYRHSDIFIERAT